MSFAQKLNDIMLQRNINAYKLSKLLNVHPTTISNWLNGKTEPKLTMIKDICSVLNISLNYFIDDTAKKKSLNIFELSGSPRTEEEKKKSPNILELLGIPRTEEEYEARRKVGILIKKYEALNQQGKEKLLIYADDLYTNPQYKEKDIEED